MASTTQREVAVTGYVCPACVERTRRLTGTVTQYGTTRRIEWECPGCGSVEKGDWS